MRLLYPTDSQISQSRDADQTIAAIGSEFKARVIVYAFSSIIEKGRLRIIVLIRLPLVTSTITRSTTQSYSYSQF